MTYKQLKDRFVFKKDKASFIGKGSFSTVFRGHFKNDPNRIVAIKIISRLGMDQKMELHLKQEINALRSIEDRNVVRLYDVHTTKTKYFLIMEFCGGGDLSSYLKKNKNIPTDVCRKIFRQTARGLKAVSVLKLMHRDLKPANILLSSKDPETMEAKIADFGFAKMLTQTLQLNKTICGSPIYMAPEILMEKEYTRSVDLWSVGCIFYELVLGKPPFVTNKYPILVEMVKNDPVVYPPGMDPKIKNLLQGLLVKDPGIRMSYDEFFRHPVIGIVEEDPDLKERTRDNLSIEGDTLPIKLVGNGRIILGLAILMEGVGGREKLMFAKDDEEEEDEGEVDEEVGSAQLVEKMIYEHGYFSRTLFPFAKKGVEMMKIKKEENAAVDEMIDTCLTKCRQIYSLMELCHIKENHDFQSSTNEVLSLSIFTLHILQKTLLFVKNQMDFMRSEFENTIRRENRGVIVENYKKLEKNFMPWLRGMDKEVRAMVRSRSLKVVGSSSGNLINGMRVNYVEQIVYDYALRLTNDVVKKSMVLEKNKDRDVAVLDRTKCLLELLLQDPNQILGSKFDRSVIDTLKKKVERLCNFLEK